MLSPAEARAKHPLIDLKGVTGGMFIPANGQADPANVTQALAKAARQRGVRIFENTKVTGIRQADGRVTGVDTAQGAISAEYVVNCAGLWAREVGRMAGVNVPLLAAEHFYVVTDASPEIARNLPVLRVPDESAYIKEEAGKLLIGFFEPRGKALPDSKIPEDSEFLNLPDDWEHLARELELAAERLPILKRIGLHTFFNGPESFTPDGRWVLGEAPSPAQFLRCRRLQFDRHPDGRRRRQGDRRMDAGGRADARPHRVDIRRCQPFHGNATYLADRIGEALGLHYADQFPYRSPTTARGVRTTPLHERLAQRGACFTEAAGWERAGWFLPEAARARGEKAEYRYSWGRQNWFDHAAEEHKAVRTGVGLFDLSPFGKIRVEGRDAEDVLQRISANDVAVAPGRIVYTQWLNAPRRHRGRPDHRAALQRRVPRGYVVGDGAARSRLVEAPHPGRRALRGNGRHLSRGLPRRDGTALARAAVAVWWTCRSPTRRSRSALGARSRSAMRSRGHTASPMSASWAGSCTCRPTWRGRCSTASWSAASKLACDCAAATRSTAAAWRRPIATSATTSPRPTMFWRPASASL